MVNTAGKVITGKPVATGGVLAAPLGTALPVTAVAAPNVAFKALGYVSEDGLEKSESRDNTEIKEWGGLTVRKSQTGFEATFQFQFLEYLNADAAKQVYGDASVTVVAATSGHGEQLAIVVKGQESPHKAWIFDMADGLTKTRIVVPDGQITDVGSTTFAVEDAAVRDVTITCYPDANGVLYFEYTDDGIVTP